MSDSDVSVARLRWFSVILRFFTPDIDPYCHVGNWTVRAGTAERAAEMVRNFVDQKFFDQTSRQYYLPGGIPVSIWHYDTREIPAEHALLLEKNADPEQSLDVGAPVSEEVRGDNVIDLFSRRKRPAPETDPTRGGPDTPPSGAPSDNTKP